MGDLSEGLENGTLKVAVLSSTHLQIVLQPVTLLIQHRPYLFHDDGWIDVRADAGQLGQQCRTVQCFLYELNGMIDGDWDEKGSNKGTEQWQDEQRRERNWLSGKTYRNLISRSMATGTGTSVGVSPPSGRSTGAGWWNHRGSGRPFHPVCVLSMSRTISARYLGVNSSSDVSSRLPVV